MFITTEDFKVVASEASMKAITQCDPDNVENAIAEAVEEISGYLRPKYDCEKVFAMEGKQRNRQLVMYAADIALYHMNASLPSRMGAEVREQRYEQAIKWLEGVQEGKIVPDLPTPDGDDYVGGGGVLAFGKGPDNHSW